MSQFNYSISGDTLNGSLDLERLIRDYNRLGLNEELSYIHPEGDNLKFVFVDPLNDQNALDIALDDLVAQHNGAPVPEPRICKYFEGQPCEMFTRFNYKIPNLFRDETFIKGELQKVVFHEDEALTKRVVQAEFAYTRDPFGFALHRIATRTWYDEDDQPIIEGIETKKKIYSSLGMIKEGKKRRGNIVEGIQLPVMSFMLEVLSLPPYSLDSTSILLTGREFMDRFEDEFNKFIDNSSTVTSGPNVGMKSVVVAINEAADNTDPWLKEKPSALGGSISIEDYLVSEFSI